MKQNNFSEKVYQIVMKIPQGRVATYAQVAKLCGSPRAARAVGSALHKNPKYGIIPCYRVVNRNGRLSYSFAFGGINQQKLLLESEGVFVDEKYQIDLLKYGW